MTAPFIASSRDSGHNHHKKIITTSRIILSNTPDSLIAMAPIRVLVVGAGHMGRSHAFAYSKLPGFEVVGIVTRTPESRLALVKELGSNIPDFGNFDDALAQTHPDAVCVCSYPDSHYKYAIAALDANCDVFVEKPLAATVAEAEEIVSKANQMNKKVVVGYILRQHPTWQRFIEVSHDLGKPLVMRMNLNQQSSGATWKTHKALMETCSPIVDCGVHYIDVMVQMTRSKPIRVSGICARLSDEIKPDMFNYGHLQVVFEDGSVGFYEAGWFFAWNRTRLGLQTHFFHSFKAGVPRCPKKPSSSRTSSVPRAAQPSSPAK